MTTVIFKPVGNRCNKNCLYCCQSKSSDNEIGGLPAIDELFRKIEIAPNTLFVFHGGEPLLMDKDYFSALLQSIQNNGKNPVFQIQTNGTLLEDWLPYLSRCCERIDISVSIDPTGEQDCRFFTDVERALVLNNVKKTVATFGYAAVVSVMHKKNINSFTAFIDELVATSVKYLTINKIVTNKNCSDLAITESEYEAALEKISLYWIRKRLYEKIQIQPLMSLFSKQGGRLCLFNPDQSKCQYFIVITPKGIQHGCPHKIGNPTHIDNCRFCSTFEWCGGGCPYANYDTTFCEARTRLKSFIESIVL